MPSGRCLPSPLGMNTRRTRLGWYVCSLSWVVSSSSQRSRPYASMSSKVWPSIPGAPSLERQRQVGELQNVSSVHLVVKPIEPIPRRSLRFGMQRRLEFLNLRWRCEAHANLPALMPLGTLVLNSGPFPPPELPGFHGTTSLSATPFGPACPSRASGWRSRASTDWGFPCCSSFPCVDMPSPLPRWDRWVRSFLGGALPPVSLFASDGGLPRIYGGSAPTLNLSRPAQCSLTLRPVDSPHRQAVHLSRRLRRLRYLHRRSDSFRLERSNLAGWDLHPLG